MAIKRTRSSIIESSASTSISPVGRSGTTSTMTPVRSATWRNAITFEAYSLVVVRMRSPSANRIAVKARSQARVALSARAISEGSAPISLASVPYTASRSASKASAVSYPPNRNSSFRYPVIVSSTGRGIKEAPALLKCATKAVPGVSALTAAMSIISALPEAQRPSSSIKSTMVGVRSIARTSSTGTHRASAASSPAASFPPTTTARKSTTV